MPRHNHEQSMQASNGGIAKMIASPFDGNIGGVPVETNSWRNGTDVIKTSSTGSGSPHNNMPPYLAVNMWQRIG